MSEKIRDYATGKLVVANLHEAIRQEFEHMLIDELGYPKEHIEIEFPIQRGSKKRAEEADIVVFKSSKHTQENLYVIVEIEPPGRPFDMQVFSYVTATTAEFAVWFDGLDKARSQGALYYWRDMASDPTKFLDIPTLPHFSETIEEIGKYKKYQLKPALSLKVLFQKMHNRLYGEGPLKREDEIAQEVIKLLFCKLYDELHVSSDTCEFRATVTELKTKSGQKEVASRVKNLFSQLKDDPLYSDMFASEELLYDARWISYIVSELQPFGLSHEATNTDAMGDAYEVFIGPQLKGESGQFFTPRAVVRLAIDMLKPSLLKRERIIDPACGSGGFLIHALRAAKREAEAHYTGRSKTWVVNRIKEYANSFMVGIDIEPLLYKVAKSYMAIVGNGRTGICCEDTLQPPTTWQQESQNKAPLGRFDVLVTNPPFGTKIKVENHEVLDQFDLGHVLIDGKRSDKVMSGGQDPAILFLERSWQFLRSPKNQTPGGRLGIVLPRQVLSGHDSAMVEIREWILRNMRVLAVVDLPPETFQPYTGTITSLLFAQRVSYPIEDDYSIFMAVAKHAGHDRRGNPLFARTAEGSIQYDSDNNPIILNDLPVISSAYGEYRSHADFLNQSPSTFSIKVSDVRAQSRCRLDAWYYDPTKNDIVKGIWDSEVLSKGAIKTKTIGELVRQLSDVFYPGRHRRNYCAPGPDAVPFLSGTNILQVRAFDVKWQPRAYPPIQKHLVQRDWILITRSGSVGRVVYVGDTLAGFPIKNGVAVSEHVIRVIPDPEEVDSGYLYAFLASEAGKVVLTQGIYASVVQHITPQHILEIPVPLPSPEIQKEIGDRVRKTTKMRAKANRTALEAQEMVQNQISEILPTIHE